MKKITKTKGFTLIELLAVIAIISLISVIIIPNITKTSIRTKKNLYKTKVKSIVKAKKMCEQDGEEDCDVIGVLLAKKYLVGDNGSNCNGNCLKNPIDGTYMDNCFVTYNDISCSNRAENAVNKIKNIAKDEPDDTLDVITKPAPEGATCTNTFAYDGTSDNNLRYVGANPCNYVSFNNELWRIIGVMNNIDDGTGNLETRVKLIRNESLGDYSWDTSELSVNTGYGVNDWTQADLKNELNGDYLDTTLTANTNWYNGTNNARTGVFDYTKGLKAEAQAQIGDAKWNLGGRYSGGATASTFYTAERGTSTYSTSHQCVDGACPRATEWTGKVALMYPSDYGYAVGGTVRSTCLSKNLSTYNLGSCYKNDWICLNTIQWFLAPSSLYRERAFLVGYTGSVGDRRTDSNLAARPVVYLKSSVSISSGNGSESKPYQIP